MHIDGRMIAGAPLTYWIGFHAVVLLLLVIDLVLLGSRRDGPRFRTALAWTIFLVGLALAFAAFVHHTQGRERALEFVSGYVLEGSLSIDNLFVFLVLLGSFGLTVSQQHRVLLYGVLGAIVLRAFFIVAGVALLDRFAAMQYIFGALLLYAAWRLMRQKRGRAAPPSLTQWVHSRGWRVSPLLLAVVTVEITDLIFAIDSVPAVLAVTHDTFIVYTSNIFAILGLRSLYFVLQGLLHRLHLLHYGLAAILAFVGGKMIAARWFEIPTFWSLVIILGTVAIFAAASLLIPAQPQRSA
ncbi:MAG TPA: branched-chain amino acid ABC transporter substrate-binding protein [Acidobacteriaceae bacterium]|jgi:tellurite resistance protein TerC